MDSLQASIANDMTIVHECRPSQVDHLDNTSRLNISNFVEVDQEYDKYLISPKDSFDSKMFVNIDNKWKTKKRNQRPMTAVTRNILSSSNSRRNQSTFKMNQSQVTKKFWQSTASRKARVQSSVGRQHSITSGENTRGVK